MLRECVPVRASSLRKSCLREARCCYARVACAKHAAADGERDEREMPQRETELVRRNERRHFLSKTVGHLVNRAANLRIHYGETLTTAAALPLHEYPPSCAYPCRDTRSQRSHSASYADVMLTKCALNAVVRHTAAHQVFIAPAYEKCRVRQLQLHAGAHEAHVVARASVAMDEDHQVVARAFPGQDVTAGRCSSSQWSRRCNWRLAFLVEDILKQHRQRHAQQLPEFATLQRDPAASGD